MEIGKEMQLVCGDTQVRIYDYVYLHTTLRVNPHEVDVQAWDMHACMREKRMIKVNEDIESS